MRIRSIRPEFWTSEDVAALPWPARLVFIGLWSYVDDNGVGRDVERLIAADLFPLDEDTHGVLMQVAGALKLLETGGQVTRYRVAGKPYLHVTSWDKHQKINRPSEGRYPLPTCINGSTHGGLSEPSVSPQAESTVGEGEKGRRGEGRKTSADAVFEVFWKLYPRKVAKQDARKVWDRKIKVATPEVITDGLQRYLPVFAKAEDARFIPHPSTWLQQGRWEDDLATVGRQRNPNIPEGWGT